MPVYGDGSNRRDWIFVEDHAVVRWCACWSLASQARRYAIGARQPRTNPRRGARDHARNWIAVAVRRIPPARASVLIHFVTDRPGHDFRYRRSSLDARAETALGWTAPHDFEAGLARTIEWYLANREWWQAVRVGRYAGQRLGTAA